MIPSSRSQSTRRSSTTVGLNRTVGSVLSEVPSTGYRLRPQSTGRSHGHPPLAPRTFKKLSLSTCDERSNEAFSTRSEINLVDLRSRLPRSRPSSVAVPTALEASASRRSFVDSTTSTLPSSYFTMHCDMPVNVRLFTHILAGSNELTTRIRAMEEYVFLRGVRRVGERLGLRIVHPNEFTFLLSSVLRDCDTIVQEGEAHCLFNFLDWHAKGTIDFKELLSNLGTLFRTTEVIVALCCKRLMGTKLLDNTLVSMTEVDAMLEALQCLFAEYITPSSLGTLCQEVHRTLMELQLHYNVPTTAVRATFCRFPTLVDMLRRLQWDGTVKLPQKRRNELRELLVKRPSLTKESGSRRSRQRQADERIEDNHAILRHVNKLYQHRGCEEEDTSEKEKSVSLDIRHPQFVADRYLDRSRYAPVPV